VFLRVAGLTIQITAADALLPLALGRAASRFAVEPGTADADVRVEVSIEDLAEVAEGDLIFDSGGPWRLYREPSGLLFQCLSPPLGAAPYKIAKATHDFSRVQVVMNRSVFRLGRPIEPLEYPLDELIVTNLLGQGRGLEIHGCGVIDASGDGYLFVGQSGAGKSTMARLWLGEHGTEILSDDRVVLRRESDGFWMYGTPWHGEEPLASPGRALVKGLFLLEQHPTDQLAPLSRGQAAARLFAASFPPFHSAPAIDFSLELVASATLRIPCHELRFAPSRSVVDFVRSSN
jgi:hypothetical protein